MAEKFRHFDSSHLGLLLVDESSEDEKDSQVSSENEITSHLYITSTTSSRSASSLKSRIFKTFFDRTHQEPIKNDSEDQADADRSKHEIEDGRKQNAADLYESFKTKWVAAKQVVEERKRNKLNQI